MWAEVAVAVVVMVIEILNKHERGRSGGSPPSTSAAS